MFIEMKDLFFNNQKYMFRIPTDYDKDITFTGEEIENICKDPVFREKVRVASHSLVDMMDIYLEKSKGLSSKKLNAFYASVMEYLIRSTTRTTPFGLFAGVGIGKFNDCEEFYIKAAKFQKKVNADSEWLYGLISLIEKKYMEQLNFKVNEACYVKGNRVLLIYTTEKDTDEISVRYTNVFKIVYEICQQYCSYSDIFKAVKASYKDTDDDIISNYIKELISKEILISDLRPSFNCNDQLKYLKNQCDKENIAEVGSKIEDIREMCKEYEATDIGEGINKFNNIVCKMKELYKSPYYIQVDTVIKDCNISLKYEVARDINRLASFFVYISNKCDKRHTYLDEYRDKFIEKYGVDREVPILEMMDSSIGIGAPISYMNPLNDYYEKNVDQDNCNPDIKNYLIRKYEKAIEESTSINLNMNEIQNIMDCTVDLEEVPVSMELYFILKKKNDKIQLYLGPNCGSKTAGRTFGRFSIYSEEFAEVVHNINDEERKVRNSNVEICEVEFLPAVTRDGNVTRTLSYREKELTVFTNSNKDEDHNIHLKDIFIGIDNNKFYAKNNKTGKYVVFESNNMYNPMLHPNALRFLKNISEDEGRRSCLEFPWAFVYAQYRHIPQIKFNNIIIQNERWKINKQEMAIKKDGFEEFKNKFIEAVSMAKMPKYIYIVEADNRIKLNLDKAISLRIIYEEFKKNKDQDLVFERLEDGQDIVFNDGNPYVSEIVVPLFRKNEEKENTVEFNKEYIPLEKHNIIPFDGWLYLKLYCNENREEELIAFYILDFAEEIKEKYGIQYFFIRYADPKPHVRLRFKGSQTMLYQIMPLIMEWCSKLYKDRIIGDMNLSVYEREIERYGGIDLIDQAERIFFTDSLIVENILNLKRTGQLAIDINKIAIISTIMYITNFFDMYDEQLDFVGVNYHSNEFMTDFKKQKNELLEICGIENNWLELTKSEEGKLLFNILSSVNEEIEIYKKKINEKNQNKVFKNGIVTSVIHLHCNRLIGTDRNLEKKLMAFVESIFYAKKYIMKRNEDNAGK